LLRSGQATRIGRCDWSTTLDGLDRSGSISRILGLALVGAVVQLAAVVATTAGFYIPARDADLRPPWPLTLCQPGSSCSAATYLVRWSYLLTAIGVALTDHRIVARAVEWLRATSRPKAPAPTLKVMAAQLLIAPAPSKCWKRPHRISAWTSFISASGFEQSSESPRHRRRGAKR